MIVHAPTPQTKIAPVIAPPVAKKDWWVEVAVDRADFETHRFGWEQLAKEAIEPNVFYEPWMFLPAFETFGKDVPLACAFVYRHDPRPKKLPQLCGFFPLERRSRFKGLPISTLRLWEHIYAFLCTPLVHGDWAREALHAFFDWIKTDARPSLLQLPMVNGDGPFHHALIDVLNDRRVLSYTDDEYSRAAILRAADAEAYCQSAMAHGSRKEWSRQRRRLGEQGTLESRVLEPDGDAESWIAQFLGLEASGWKGKESTALAMSANDREYFRTIARNAHARGQLQMLGIYFDGRPIALKCNFLTHDGGFAFKIAFDESFAKSSPGVQLELDNIEEMHRRPDLRWMDSCACARHFMISRLWKERRTIQNLVLATSRWTGNAVVGMLPMLRACKRMWK